MPWLPAHRLHRWIDAFYGPDNIHSERRAALYRLDTKAGLL